MQVLNGVWTMWRTSPGLSQRIMLTPLEGGRAMTAVLEKSSDGKRWDHDIDRYFSPRRSTTTAPPFMTQRTRSVTAVMSASGSPSTAMMSAK